MISRIVDCKVTLSLAKQLGTNLEQFQKAWWGLWSIMYKPWPVAI